MRNLIRFLVHLFVWGTHGCPICEARENTVHYFTIYDRVVFSVNSHVLRVLYDVPTLAGYIPDWIGRHILIIGGDAYVIEERDLHYADGVYELRLSLRPATEADGT